MIIKNFFIAATAAVRGVLHMAPKKEMSDNPLTELIRVETEKKENPLYLDRNLDLRSLAEYLGTNKHYLSDALKPLGGFNYVVHSYRINYAKEYFILHWNASIAEMAKISGYNTVGTFRREFKKLNGGMNPREWRTAELQRIYRERCAKRE